jgi:hypothetical protein
LPDVEPAVYAATDLHPQEHGWLCIKRNKKSNTMLTEISPVIIFKEDKVK